MKLFSCLMACLLAALPASMAAQGPLLPPTSDKTGTNPLNLQLTNVMANEFQSLPDDRFVNVSRYRYAAPLVGRRMAATLTLPLVTSNVTGRSEAAFGDIGAQWTWIPWLRADRGLRTGVDTTWNSATNDALGAGVTTVAPFADFVLMRSSSLILSAGYQHRLSIGGGDDPEVSEGRVGVYAAWLPRPDTWVIVEPAWLADVEHDRTGGRVDVEYGRLLLPSFGTFVRPGVGVGSRGERPFNWKVEFGFRVIP